jgi:O-antigen/teichoic acid export membrane protein
VATPAEALPVEVAPAPGPSLRKNSLARLVADLLGIVFALVAATITARLLGPAYKGYYSSLVLLGGLFVQVFSAGLGEAAIVLSGRGKASLQSALSATTLAILPLSVAAAATFLVTATVALPAVDRDAGAAPLVASVFVALTVLYTTSVSFLVARENVVAVATLAVLSNGVTTVLLFLLLAVLDLGTAGALCAGIVGSGMGLFLTLRLLRRAGLSLRPKRVPGYLTGAARFGAALQFSNLLVLLTARLDLVLVYRLSTPAEAGSYSIALTIGTLVGAVPMALSYASFPRLAVLEDDEARDLTAQVFRIGIVAALLGGTALATATPFAVPLIFGQAYEAAVRPTLLLVPGGVLWSAQWLLCRAAAARGAPAALLTSFALSFSAMVVLDFFLVPRLGAIGAGTASLVAPFLGLIVAWLFYRNAGADWRLFIPRWGDVESLVRTLHALISAGRARAHRV